MKYPALHFATYVVAFGFACVGFLSTCSVNNGWSGGYTAETQARQVLNCAQIGTTAHPDGIHCYPATPENARLQDALESK